LRFDICATAKVTVATGDAATAPVLFLAINFLETTIDMNENFISSNVAACPIFKYDLKVDQSSTAAAFVDPQFLVVNNVLKITPSLAGTYDFFMTAENAKGFRAAKHLEVFVADDVATGPANTQLVNQAEAASNSPPTLLGIPPTFTVDATVIKQTGLLINPDAFVYQSGDAFDEEGGEIVIEHQMVRTMPWLKIT
jgi:hypothetical protein